MTMPTFKSPPPAPEKTADFANLGDHINQVVVILATEEITVTTKFNEASPAMKAVAWWFTEKEGTCREIGTVTIFWGAVRAQLKDCIGDYVIGRLIKDGRRYQLEPVRESLAAEVQKALTTF